MSSNTINTTMYFYNNELPNVGDIVMCTVIEYNEAGGFTVTLDEYADKEGFIPLCELSPKRIKKNPATFLKTNDKHPVIVMAITDVVELSLKDVNEEDREQFKNKFSHTIKLYNMCQRLEHLTKTKESVWYEAFKNALSTEGNDVFQIIHNANLLKDGQSGLPLDLEKHLLDLHVQLFGFNTHTVQKTVMIQCFRSDGNQYVKQVLGAICPPDQKDNWTTEELSEDPSRINLSIKPIGLPKLLITATSSSVASSEQKMTETMLALQKANFNIMFEM